MKSKILPLVLAATFFLVSLLTLSDYGISWDEPRHFMKGQAFLHYFLTGSKTYQNLPKEGRFYSRSLYQNDRFDGNYYFSQQPEHPPLNAILAAIFNKLFYQKLGILGDVESYHFFEIVVSALLIFVVAEWAREVYGNFAALVAGLSMALYPLFLGESHFNIKDPVETCFFSLTVYGFYKAIKNQSVKWMFFSSFMTGMALATKLNVIFIPLILFPWVALIGFKKVISKKFLPALFFYPLIVLSIYFASWPYLWQDPVRNFIKAFQYYLGMGVGTVYQTEKYLTVLGFNHYALHWVLYSTPLVILFFSFSGIIYSLRKGRFEKNKTSLLILFWFSIPLLRVTLPKMGIYGGVRQIMEYIPAMAILSGIGAGWLRKLIIKYFPKEIIVSLILISLFLPITYKLISIHPNENVYFNPLIGGLRGAKDKNFLDWGNSFGNVYRQGVNWLNKNTSVNSKVVLAVGLEGTVPEIWFRKDIKYSNEFRSGFGRDGEYVMEMSHDLGLPYYYYLEYVKKFLNPLYEVKVGGIPILKIWKNDWENTKEEYKLKKENFTLSQYTVKKNQFLVDFSKEVLLTWIDINFHESCNFVGEAFVYSEGDDKIEILHSDNFQFKDNIFSYPFAGEKTKKLRVVFDKNNDCFRKKLTISGIKLVE